MLDSNCAAYSQTRTSRICFPYRWSLKFAKRSAGSRFLVLVANVLITSSEMGTELTYWWQRDVFYVEQSLIVTVTRMKIFQWGIIWTILFLNPGRRKCCSGLNFCPRVEWRNKLICEMIGRVNELINRGECFARVDIQMPEYFQIVPWFNFAVVRSPRIRLSGSSSLSLRHS